MTQKERSEKIAIACQEILKDAPKPKSKTANWNVHKLVKNNRETMTRLIQMASEKHGIDEKTLTLILLR